MSQATRFVFGLVLGLALLTWGTFALVQNTTRAWIEKDVRLRAELAVGGARQSLGANWRSDRGEELRDILRDIARDERIMAAAACDADAYLLAGTEGFPSIFSCDWAAGRGGDRIGPVARTSWHGYESLPGGPIMVSVIPLADAGLELGSVILIHDLSFAYRREASTRKFILIAFAFLAFAASITTIIVARLTSRSWSEEIRRIARGEPSQRPEFRPVLRDVRELVDRIMIEKETESEGGAWTPQRLKSTLSRHLHGERVVIVANREPYIHERRADGSIQVIHPASGLVTALEPVLRACSGVWIAHGGGSADRDTVDRNSHVRVPPGEESYFVRRVWLSREEELGYYYGFSNEGLWPLCHIADARPTFRGEDWQHYQSVNRKFADAVCEEVDSDDPIILVQDYHFTLLPRMIRERLPQATVIMFWHIPWPNSERFGICPWRREILEGMLGNSIIGFHTQIHCNNFFDSVDRFLETRIDRELHAVVQHGRSTLVRSYPIALEWPVPWTRSLPSPAECRAGISAELGLKPGTLLGVGVDRLDYTKGVEERLLAVERLLEKYPEFLGRFTFAQLAAPSRILIERYRRLNETVEEVTARINGRFARDGYRPIVLLRSHQEPSTIFRYYRAADLCYVSSLHDGMNLVAKEFVAARDDDRGVLVLSQFTGAARELTEALIVNPYDLEEASSALATALKMTDEEQRVRMRSMRAFLAEFNVYRWAGRMLVDAARLRRRERLTGRISGGWARGATA